MAPSSRVRALAGGARTVGVLLLMQPVRGLLIPCAPLLPGARAASALLSGEGEAGRGGGGLPGGLAHRPSQWAPPRLMQGMLMFARPPLREGEGAFGAAGLGVGGVGGQRGLGDRSRRERGRLGRMEGKTTGRPEPQTESFAQPQRPNLDPDVGRYQEELQAKVARVRELLQDHLEGVELHVQESPPLNYRMRAEFRVWHAGDDAHFALFDPVTKKPILIEEYPLASKRINKLMADLLQALKEDENLKKKLFQVELISNTDDEALVCLVYKKKLDAEEWGAGGRGGALAKRLGAEVILRTKGTRIVAGEKDHLVQRYEVGGRVYPQWVTENKFSQSNGHICQAMLAWAQEQLRPEGGGGVRDHDLIELYCGNGNFTLPLATLFRKVFATELDKFSVKAAIECAEQAGLANVQLAALSAEEAVQALGQEREFFRLREVNLQSYIFGVLVVDPPRAGLDAASLSLARKFKEVIYVSCNPAKLAQDLAELPGHKVVSAALFDQFPWTQHAEVAVKLVRK